MDPEILEKYRRAGKIAGEALNYCCSLAKPGAKLLDIAEKTEGLIKSKGGGLAFPLNIGINSTAAHYTPFHNDEKVFHEGELVKLDLGAHIDGYIADTARTVEIGSENNQTLILAAEKALEKAIETVRAEISVSDVGKAIEKEINLQGFLPINNLSGHRVDKYDLHQGLTVPNVGKIKIGKRLKEGYAVAIEPFATNGAGHVKESVGGNIFMLMKPKLARYPSEKQFLSYAEKQFKTLPFAERWCTEFAEKDKLRFLLGSMTRRNIIYSYPQLVEAGNGMVAQAEHTVIVTRDGCEPITRVD
jgi:methionyl aminopeptidase